jgi:hypothetical protein
MKLETEIKKRLGWLSNSKRPDARRRAKAAARKLRQISRLNDRRAEVRDYDDDV